MTLMACDLCTEIIRKEKIFLSAPRILNAALMRKSLWYLAAAIKLEKDIKKRSFLYFTLHRYFPAGILDYFLHHIPTDTAAFHVAVQPLAHAKQLFFLGQVYSQTVILHRKHQVFGC